MSADIFISYKSEEEAYARKIRSVLEANGISCWMAPDSIPVGSNYMKQIPLAIESCKAMILIVSEKSQQSQWVQNEFSEAMTKQKLIIPYVIENCKLDDAFQFSMSTMQQVYAWKDEEAALTKVVRDIKEAIGSDPNAEIRVSVVKKPDPKIYIAIAAAVVALLGGIWFALSRTKTEPSLTPAAAQNAGVYYSEVLPYTLSGVYETAGSAAADAMNLTECERAFSLLSFIRNEGEASVFVEKIECEILDLTPIQEPEILVDGVLIDGVFYAYAANNGWGDASAVTASWKLTPENGVPAFERLTDSLTGSDSFSLESGMAKEVFRVQPDLSELLEWARANSTHTYMTLATLVAELECEGKKSYLAMFLMYDAEKDDIVCDYGGAFMEQPSITLYGVLNVDNPPASLRFAARDGSLLVEDAFRIETVIIPTKSCEVTVRGAYSVGGKPFETEDYQVRVSVPVLDEDKFIVGGELTRELTKINMDNPSDVKRLLSKYRYDIESILPEDAPRG